jgi:hypothetical protein
MAKKSEGQNGSENGERSKQRTRTSHPDPAQVVRAKIGGHEVSIEFSHYALNRAKTRGVSMEEIVTAIRSPDERNLETDSPDRLRYRRYRSGGHTAVEVVFERPEPDRYVIVTTFVFSGRG